MSASIIVHEVDLPRDTCIFEEYILLEINETSIRCGVLGKLNSEIQFEVTRNNKLDIIRHLIDYGICFKYIS